MSRSRRPRLPNRANCLAAIKKKKNFLPVLDRGFGDRSLQTRVLLKRSREPQPCH